MRQKGIWRRLETFLVLVLVLASQSRLPAPTVEASGLGISNLTTSQTTVTEYAKFEITFSIDNTIATNLQFPYDPAPPPGLSPGVGVTVNGLFLPPGQADWSRAIVQPGFLFQDYQRQQIGGQEWDYPNGNPVWKIRFSPQAPGIWQYLVEAQDASICAAGVSPCLNWTKSAAGSFTVTAPDPGNHGFIRVSKTDPRYFEFSDGKAFVPLGYNAAFSNTYSADNQFAKFTANGLDFFRVWMSGSTIAGSAWDPWDLVNAPAYGGYLPDPGLAVAPAGSGHDYVFSLDQSVNRPCLRNGWTKGQVAVKPGTTYQLSATFQLSNVVGPRNSANPNYGFTLKAGGWSTNCPDDLVTAVNLLPYTRTTNGWTTVTATFTTSGSQYFLGDLYAMLDNVSSGQAQISQMSLREVSSGGGKGPELLVKSKSDADMDFNLLQSWQWDYIFDQAAQDGIYLKVVVLEKNDRVWNDINADGTMTSTGGSNNFYAAPNTKIRSLHQYYWRYLISRWGYSTAIHSWELMNEGDPFNGNHYNQANSFAQYMHANDPSRQLITTSMWAAFPVAQFWGNPQYPDVDYADVHYYVNTSGTYEWNPPTGTALDTNPSDTYQASVGALKMSASLTSGSASIPIRGQGTWTVRAVIQAQGISGSCPYGASATLAGPQLLVGLDSPNTTLVPPDPGNSLTYWTCTSPAGTYPYTQMTGSITLPDSSWHTLTVTFKTNFATTGTVWFDNLQILSPDGREARLNGDGTFDDHIRLDQDTAWLPTTIGLDDGALSLTGAGKPLIQGEWGISNPTNTGEDPSVAQDTRGVWLHNNLWASLGPVGVTALYWWNANITQYGLYFQFAPVRSFLEGIPLNNGYYQDAQARATAPTVRVLGQKDLVHGQAHLWIANTSHTWTNVINGVPWGSLSGTVSVTGFVPNQTYPLQLWEFDDPGNLTTVNSTVTADGNGTVTLNLSSLPANITDTAVKIGSFAGLYAQSLAPLLR